MFFPRFRMRVFIASSGLLSAILRSDRPGVSGSPPALMWRMLSCHLSAFKAFGGGGPPGPSHAPCVRQSGGSPPPPPPPPQRSTLYIIFLHLKYRFGFSNCIFSSSLISSKIVDLFWSDILKVTCHVWLLSCHWNST